MEFKGKKILVVGLARSGLAALTALHQRQAILTAYDVKKEAELGQELEQLKKFGISIYAGSPPPMSKDNFDLVVVSPGVPLDATPVKEAFQQGITVIGELELAYLLKSYQVEMYAITGTNGKTTTTSLLHHILLVDGRKPLVGGNIGVALCSLANHLRRGIIVVEVSSFQLETVSQFRPHIGAVLNITPDHLDRHNTMDNYIDIKGRIFSRQEKNDYIILNFEDPRVKAMASQARSQVLFFSTRQVLEQGVFIENGGIYVAMGNKKYLIMSLERVTLRGQHNLENILCAIGMAWVAGVKPQVIGEAVATFKGVRHRLEEIGSFQGVLYINDSKGTNPDSTIKALEAMDRPVVLIAGGRPKGGSYTGLAQMIKSRVKALVLIGEARELIKKEVMDCGFENIYEVEDFPSAVYKSRDLAHAGDVVLLSPACASWDMFPSYEHRGDLFCKIIREMVGSN